MKLNLRRFLYEEDTTLGYLLVNDKFECWTLEDKVRDVKIKHETAIPTGIYTIVLTDKNKWNKVMPHLVDVPNFDGIYMHAGNSNSDTSGCPLVADKLVNLKTNESSKIAFDRLMEKFRLAEKNKEDIFISVEDYIRPI